MSAAIEALDNVLTDARAMREMAQMKLDQAAQRVTELEQAIAILSNQPTPPWPGGEPATPEQPAEFACETCGQTFATQNGLGGHMSVHTRIEQECPNCGRTLKSGPGYASHVRFCPPPSTEPTPAESPLASVVTDIADALGPGATVAHIPPTPRDEHPAMVLCACAHSGRRHDDDGQGVCAATGCGCTEFRRAAS